MKWTGLSPFQKVLYGHAHPLYQGYTGGKEIGDLTLRQQMQALRLTLSKINDWVWERLPVNLTTPTHPHRPGGAIWVKEWRVQPLKPHWRDPFVVILTTPTAAKVAEIAAWIHHRRVKPDSLEWEHILTQSHHTRSPPGIPTPFPGRTLFPRRQQEIMNNRTTVWKLTILCTVEAQTWHAPQFSSTCLGSYLLGWPLQGFPHVLNVIREPLLGLLHSHTLYHTLANRSDVTSAHICLGFVRLLVGDTGGPRGKQCRPQLSWKVGRMGLLGFFGILRKLCWWGSRGPSLGTTC
jgi:hypothetical protein